MAWQLLQLDFGISVCNNCICCCCTDDNALDNYLIERHRYLRCNDIWSCVNCIRYGPLQIASHCLCRHGTANSRHSHSCKSCCVVGKKFAIQCARVAKLPNSMRLTDTVRNMDLQISMKAASEDGHTALYLTLKAEMVKADAELQAARSGERHP